MLDRLFSALRDLLRPDVAALHTALADERRERAIAEREVERIDREHMTALGALAALVAGVERCDPADAMREAREVLAGAPPVRLGVDIDSGPIVRRVRGDEDACPARSERRQRG